jgi:hypothetical protein
LPSILAGLGATLPISHWAKVTDQTSLTRDLGENVAPRPKRPAGSQTHKSRRGLGESRYWERSGILERLWDNPTGRVTGGLVALVGAHVMGEHRHPALVEQFTVLERALSILRFGG